MSLIWKEYFIFCEKWPLRAPIYVSQWKIVRQRNDGDSTNLAMVDASEKNLINLRNLHKKVTKL